ncbi:beta-ketoacyl-[acyl-carrier-protein] synthase family protein [Pseudomonas sp. ICMP22404]|uniref:beta-ketoacyl-[acyl-carrier-protein] synthase family protein n=1 Tax=Pseudomonas TaxID=286 RepID=UPI001119A4CB|nr:beta-ketoacyl-[acyl-carrier-protein] synthase family protein [Pseudomonas sp. ICMP22404]NUT68111.1 beta-ketoacyl-[acyl-carrier-protein] synthase family protein [Pseudomonas corrugata]TNF84092.1 beta-ketoacyl-[acyl-carrier-protein] synthase family protein [Pseudomonas sp. ICMP22404]
MNAVVITGVGCVSPFGVGRQALWDGLAQGRGAIGPVPSLSEAVGAACNAGAAPEDALVGRFSANELLLLDRASQFALLAAAEAADMAAIDLAQVDPTRCAVYMGTAVGGSESLHSAYLDLYQARSSTLAPWTVPRVMANAAASHLSLKYGFKGPALTISTACASSTQAIGEAYRLLRHGDADLVMAGGTDACLNALVWKAWEALRAMAPDTCRPFSSGRRGMVLGEGGGVLVMETLAHAQARGAPILAQVLGYGVNSDAGDLLKPSVDGPAQAMRQAIADSRLPAETFGYINAHGTGTLLNDRCETAAIKQVFGSHASQLCVSSVKSAIGHLMGAAGVVELIGGLMGSMHGQIPGTLNYLGRDAECDLDYVTEGTRQANVQAWLKNSFAFGGLNVSLALATGSRR